MKIYLVKNETEEILNTFENVIAWSYDFVEYQNGGRCKIYCDVETEHFTDEITEVGDAS